MWSYRITEETCFSMQATLSFLMSMFHMEVEGQCLSSTESKRLCSNKRHGSTACLSKLSVSTRLSNFSYETKKSLAIASSSLPSLQSIIICLLLSLPLPHPSTRYVVFYTYEGESTQQSLTFFLFRVSKS